MHAIRIAGAPGTGKSTVAWMLARDLADAGTPTGFLDIDQLGMCYPESADDPGRWSLKDRALDAVAEEFRLAGVASLVVSGVAEPDVPPRPVLPARDTRSVWLDASSSSRRERLGVRSWSAAQIAETVTAGSRESARVHPAWTRVATDDRSPSQTASDVDEARTRIESATRRGTLHGRDSDGESALEHVLWITGPRLAGSSSVGWQLVSEDWEAGVHTGFADAAQLSFVWNTPTPTTLRALTALGRVFAELGARRMVVVAPIEVDSRSARDAWSPVRFQAVRLDPDISEVRARASVRRRGHGPLLSGDDLWKASADAVEAVARAAQAQSAFPPRRGEIRVATSGLDVVTAAATVRRAIER